MQICKRVVVARYGIGLVPVRCGGHAGAACNIPGKLC